ncbi:MAG: hypothetical protein ACOCZB_05135 [Spirochaetota bacterium]
MPSGSSQAGRTWAYVSLGISIAFNSAALIFLRALIDRIAPVGGLISIDFFLAALGNWLFWAGAISFAANLLFWIHSMRHVPLSLAYPTAAASYVILTPFARYLFGEAVTICRVIGIFAIVAGVTLLYWKPRRVEAA